MGWQTPTQPPTLCPSALPWPEDVRSVGDIVDQAVPSCPLRPGAEEAPVLLTDTRPPPRPACVIRASLVLGHYGPLPTRPTCVCEVREPSPCWKTEPSGLMTQPSACDRPALRSDCRVIKWPPAGA